MANYITAAEIDNIASETGKALAAQKKVSIMIAPGGDPTFRCTINGYKFEFPKGEMVEVPEDVAKFISDRAQASIAAKKMRDGMKNTQV